VVQSLTQAYIEERVVIADEADEYTGALPGLTLDVVRTGAGYGPNVAKAEIGESVTVFSARFQFPVLGRTTVADDTIVIALIVNAPTSSRWSGIDLESNSLLLYGPGVEHTGVSPAGLIYSGALLNISALEESAERRGIGFTVPKRGRVVALDPSQALASAASLLRSASDPFDEYGAVARNGGLLHTVGTMLSPGRPASYGPGRRVLDSRSLVQVCIEYVDATQETSSVASSARRPTIAELCMVAHVSERRLRNAFYDSFGMAPLRYFRMRSMSQARSRLLDPNDSSESVPGVALDFGYDHPSRFVLYYKDVYGEHPSETAGTM
jgi:AraC-like DNA-binding protein